MPLFFGSRKIYNVYNGEICDAERFKAKNANSQSFLFLSIGGTVARRASIFQYGGEVFIMSSRKRYGFWSFIGDLIMIGLTGGLWLIWIFVREMRNR